MARKVKRWGVSVEGSEIIGPLLFQFPSPVYFNDGTDALTITTEEPDPLNMEHWLRYVETRDEEFEVTPSRLFSSYLAAKYFCDGLQTMQEKMRDRIITTTDWTTYYSEEPKKRTKKKGKKK